MIAVLRTNYAIPSPCRVFNLCHRPGKINCGLSKKHTLTHCHGEWELKSLTKSCKLQSYGHWLAAESEWETLFLGWSLELVGKLMFAHITAQLCSWSHHPATYTSHTSLPGLSATSDLHTLPPQLLLSQMRNCHSEGLNYSIPRFHPSCLLQKHSPKSLSSPLLKLPFGHLCL